MFNYNSFMALSSYQPSTKHCSFKMGGGGIYKTTMQEWAMFKIKFIDKFTFM